MFYLDIAVCALISCVVSFGCIWLLSLREIPRILKYTVGADRLSYNRAGGVSGIRDRHPNEFDTAQEAKQTIESTCHRKWWQRRQIHEVQILSEDATIKINRESFALSEGLEQLGYARAFLVGTESSKGVWFWRWNMK
jgi:hypothetical protein